MSYLSKAKKYIFVSGLIFVFLMVSVFAKSQENNKIERGKVLLEVVELNKTRETVFQNNDNYMSFIEGDLRLKADVIIENERTLERERLAALEAAKVAAAEAEAREMEAQRLAKLESNKKSSPGAGSGAPSTTKPQSRYSQLCLGSSCGNFGSYYGNDLAGLQGMIDTNIVVAKEGFSGNDGFSTYFMGHNYSAFNYLRYSLSTNDIIDVYDSGGTKHSYKMIQRIQTRNDGTYNGSPTYVYGGVGPIDALYSGIYEEVIYIQYCVDGTNGAVSYVWSGVKV